MRSRHAVQQQLSSVPQLSNSTNVSNQLKLPSSIIMKTALVILPACLLVLAHLSSAQMLSTDIPSIDCEQVQNLSPECTTALAQGATGADQAAAFCRGDCFQTVLSAYRSCGAAGETIAQSVQEGEKRSYQIIISSYAMQPAINCSCC